MRRLNYQTRLEEHLIEYKRSVLGIEEMGVFRYRGTDLAKAHVLPFANRWANLIGPTKELVEAHLAGRREVQLHRFFHHLNSSQAFAFNLFFPFFEGGPDASAALLRALGQHGVLESWKPEAVPNKAEGTNLDAQWRLADGTTVMCEVKLSERDFGKATNNEKHRRKLVNTYRPILRGHVGPELLEEASFFRSYQILRNVWHMLSVPRSLLVFLIPRANESLWHELQPVVAKLEPEPRRRVSIIAIEDVLASLQRDDGCPDPLRGYAAQLQRKYVIASS